MRIKLYQIDAFADKVFSGNPAAVCILDKFLDKKLMQRIAAENNLAETAFIVKKDNNFEIRWFTPSIEVDLCGHATLASAYVLYEYYNFQFDKIKFYSIASGILTVKRENDEMRLRIKVLEDKNNKNEEMLKRLDEKLLNETDEKNKLIKKVDLLDFKNSTLITKINKLNLEIENYIKDIDEMNNKNITLNNEIEELKRKLEKCRENKRYAGLSDSISIVASMNAKGVEL